MKTEPLVFFICLISVLQKTVPRYGMRKSYIVSNIHVHVLTLLHLYVRCIVHRGMPHVWYVLMFMSGVIHVF